MATSSGVAYLLGHGGPVTIGCMVSDALRKAAQRRLHAVAELDAAREDLRVAILADLAAGVRQVDIAKETGYTREQIRRITRGET